MITRDNFHEIVHSLSDKDKKRILKSNKEFCVLILHIFNAGFTVDCILTDNFLKYQHVGKHGNSILLIDEIKDILS